MCSYADAFSVMLDKYKHFHKDFHTSQFITVKNDINNWQRHGFKGLAIFEQVISKICTGNLHL